MHQRYNFLISNMYPYIIYLTNNRYCNIVCDCEKKIPKKEIKKNSPFIIKVLRILHLVADSAHIMTTWFSSLHGSPEVELVRELFHI